jgi:prepilin-type N-terminal cleavage/methylation domain-containing protein
MNAHSKKSLKRKSRMRGFTMLELLVVLAISAILGAIAVPNVVRITQALRIAGDLRDLNGSVAQAKMHAASDFTHARARANLGANTFQLEIWNKALNGGAGCWQTLGDTAIRCTAATSPVQPLSSGVTFGTDKVTTAPLNTQTLFGQAALCGSGAAGIAGTPAGNIAGTACVEFNSRGIPIDAAGNPNGNGAFYVNNGTMVYGLTVAATGYALNWSAPDASGNTSWKHQ